MSTQANTQKQKRASPVIFIGALIAVCCICGVILALMDEAGMLPEMPTQQSIAYSSPVPTITKIIVPTTVSRCVPASAIQMDYVRTGIKDIQQSNDVLQGFAVRSNDFQQVWFIAAEITGPGIEPKQAIGLWAITGEPEEPGIILSVNGFAIEFSPYPDGATTDAQTSQFDDGAQEALKCATDN